MKGKQIIDLTFCLIIITEWMIQHKLPTNNLAYLVYMKELEIITFLPFTALNVFLDRLS